MQVHTRYVVDEVAHWDSFISQYLMFILSFIIPHMYHVSLLFNIALIRRTSGRILGYLQGKQFSFGYRGSFDINVL
jgi:hypothetical protein